MKVLKYIAVIYLISIIVLLNKTLEDQGCINSITVQSINIIRDQKRVFLPSCYFGKKHSGTPVLGDKKIIENLKSDLESFETFIANNKYFYKPNSLKIVIRDSINLSVSANEINMNFDYAKDQMLFRKNLLKSWFLIFASEKVKNDKFLQEILSDTFLYIFWNDMSWEKEFNFDRWLKYIYSERDICTTNYIPEERNSLCELISKNSKNKKLKFDQVSLWSLRPLVVNRIVDYYDQMNFDEKLKFSKYWLHFVTVFEGELPSNNLNLENLSRIYNSYMNALVEGYFNAKFDEKLDIDYVFEFNTERENSMVSYKSDLPFYMLQNILFKYKDNVFINLRNGSKFISNKNRATHWVLIQNTYPNLNQVKNIPAEYLTIIESKKNYNYDLFYKKMDNISDFPWTAEFNSLTLYIPSLKLLGKLAPKRFKGSDIKTLSLNPQVSEILGFSAVKVY